MIYDQVKFLEARWRQVNHNLGLLRAGLWWHVGSAEDCEGRMLEELDEIEFELGVIQNGYEIELREQ